jgi:hypothetical protein
VDIALYSLLAISLVVAIMLIVGDGVDRRQRERREAITRIVSGAEREMDRAASRHHTELDELRRRAQK